MDEARVDKRTQGCFVEGWEKQLEDRKQREIVQTMQAEMKEERRIEKEVRYQADPTRQHVY
ncbi:hypothetical protein HDU83_001487 [Entophlyctis luteolus]|nr:hypothetical protein HDU83_001487 [Entophlyctis luteolus]